MCIFGCGTTDKNLMSPKCIDVKSCAHSIMQRVRENSQWICDQKSNDKVVIIQSSFSKTGKILEIKLISSSDDEEFDNAALNAIKSAVPFVELTMLNPKEFEEASIINFKFIGNVKVN
ncbi:hypothetical protein SOPP22_07505 [Shewanella sp. OPT22]|nr:hypothetical protein SOPP22_07505 [Shewanella sp. OPT22]